MLDNHSRIEISSLVIFTKMVKITRICCLFHVPAMLEYGRQVSTRSQAVARIADRTASQHLWGLCDIIGHVTI